jgi:hypothetical protein
MTDMTQAPTPGPLLKGDIVRGPNGQIETVKSANPDFVVLVSGNGYLPSLVTFIGRPDAEGWMPWSGGENPVPGQRVERKERSGDLVWCACLSDHLRWTHSGWDTDIIAFRIAPTAPVEASGSEREITIKVGDDHLGPWRIWFDPPPIGSRNCDWHYQHEDDDGCGGRSGSCGSRDECLEEIIIQYEERGS